MVAVEEQTRQAIEHYLSGSTEPLRLVVMQPLRPSTMELIQSFVDKGKIILIDAKELQGCIIQPLETQMRPIVFHARPELPDLPEIPTPVKGYHKPTVFHVDKSMPNSHKHQLSCQKAKKKRH